MWTNDAVLRLVELYRSYDCLWDTTNDGYKNKNKKNDAWDEIARVMDMPRREVEMKVHSLRSQFIRERKKIKMAIETGGLVKPSTWFAYSSLLFLLKGEIPAVNLETGYKHDSNQGSPSTNDSELESNQGPETYNEIENVFEQNESKSNTANDRKRPHDDTSDNPAKNKRIVDEFEIYGQYVASELRNVKSEQAMLMAKYYINNIILDARRGKLEADGGQGGSNAMVDGASAPPSYSDRLMTNKPVTKNESITNLIVEVKCEPSDD